MWRLLAFPALLLLLAPPGLAQDAAGLPSCRAAGITPPTPSNNHAATSDDYPLLSVSLGEQGDAVISLTVGADGAVSDAHILRSSGFARLDDASISLAQQRWRYNPATKNGAPIACRMEAEIRWRLEFSPEQLEKSPVIVKRADLSDYPADAIAKHEEGIAVVTIAITPGGSVSSVNGGRSSGYSYLDGKSLDIAKTRWRFRPATMDGEPVKTVVLVAIVWELPQTGH